MKTNMHRRGFIETGSAAVVLAALGDPLRALGQQTAPPTAAAPAWEKPPALKPEDVQAFVGVAHRDIDKVREMLDAQPTLVNASWDWTGGDWETAMAATFHRRFGRGAASERRARLMAGAAIGVIRATMRYWYEKDGKPDLARLGQEALDGLEQGFLS